MVAHSIRHDSTLAAVRLLDVCVQPQGDIHMDRFIGHKKAKDVYGVSQ